MNVRMIEPEEWLRTEELFALAFEQPMKRKEVYELDKALHWAAFDEDGEMMSTLTVTDFPIQFDGNRCLMGGIGGVATLPQYRRRGGIRGCFAAFFPELYQRGYDFSYLYPFSTCFYRQFGFENCVQKQAVTVDLGLLKSQAYAGVFRLAEPGRDLSGAVREIDAAWEAEYNMTVQHDDEFYNWVRKEDPAVNQEFCYVWFRPDGSPGAYTAYRKEDQSDGRNLVCSHFRFLDSEGYRALLSLFKSLAADHRYVKFDLPDHCSLRYLMPEWSLGAVSWSIIPAGMVRVIRVKDVLQKARYHGSGRAIMGIQDEMIPENNNRFAVEFSDGKPTSVTQTSALPDVTFQIPAFSALISGTCAFSDAVKWMDGITIHKNNPALEQIIYRKPLYLADYF